MGLASAGILLALAVAIVIHSGRVPVAATATEPPLLRKLIHGAYERSLARAAGAIQPPADLDQEALIRRGAANFASMCSLCHTPPGEPVSVQAQGMNPPPPRLRELLARRSASEAFLVIRDGVRLTAMPAFGPSHDERELWALVAFLRDPRSRSASGYLGLLELAGQEPVDHDGHAHSHGQPRVATPSPAPKPSPGHHADHGHDHAH